MQERAEHRTIQISKAHRDRLEELKLASLDYDMDLEESVTGIHFITVICQRVNMYKRPEVLTFASLLIGKVEKVVCSTQGLVVISNALLYVLIDVLNCACRQELAPWEADKVQRHARSTRAQD